MSDARKPALLVLASTYPRWAGDHEPGFVHELCKRLAAQFEVRVLVPHAQGAVAKERMDRVEVIRYRYAPQWLETLAYGGGIVPKLRKQPWKWLLVPFFLLAQYFALRRQLRRWRPDVVHAHWILPQGVMAAASIGKTALVITSHGTDLFALNSSLMQRIKCYALNKSTVVTVVSEAMRETAVAMGVKPDKIFVAPMGVDLQTHFTPDKRIERSASELLFVGRLAPSKGLNILLDAMPKILGSRPDVSLTIVGFGPEETNLRAQASRLDIIDRIAFIGAIPQSALPDLYRRAAALVAPYVRTASGEQEGFGLVLVEALGCGCPVIATAMPGLRDIFGGSDGLIEPNDAGALADAVLKILGSPQDAAGASVDIRNRVAANLDWQAVSAKYAQLLANAMQLPRSA